MLASPLGPEAGKVKPCWLPALLVTLGVACFYVFLVVWIDNTVIGTSNGLWKSVQVSAWAHGAGNDLDSGGILYSPVYGRLSRLIPDSVVRYGAPAGDVTFRKMALLNALFGAAASGLVCLLAFRFTLSRWAAIAVALVHAGCGFVMLNSVNSEDIIPAYTFFLAATVCFFEFLHNGGIAFFASSAVLLALVTLFHWTVMAPALAAFGAVYAFLLPKGRTFFRTGVAWLLLFLISIRVLLLLAFPQRELTMLDALYPQKAAAGWVGLLVQKIWFLAVGIGNYFTGAFNVDDWRIPFQNPSMLRLMIFSWAAWLAGFGTCAGILFWRRVAFRFRLLAVFAVVLFLTGEAGAVYSQPQDPQMQIQPMLIVVAGVILLAAVAWRRGVAMVLLAVAAVNGYTNVHLFSSRDRGGDSRAAAGIRQIESLFPKDKTMLVAQGFEIWVSWHFALLGYRNFGEYIRQNTLLTDVFAEHAGISASDAAADVEKQIDAAFASGRRVVADSVWTDPLEQSAASFATVTQEPIARAYLSILKKRYRAGTRWETQEGPFVELLPPL